MNLPKPPHEDDLDREIRQALYLKTRRQEPSDHIWARIKAGLESGAIPKPATPQTPRIPVFSFKVSAVAQVALVMVILVFSGININSNFNQILPTAQSTEVIQPQIVEAPAALAMVAPPINDQDDYFLNKRAELQSATHDNQAVVSTPPVVIPPTDMMPHSDSPQGRLVAPNLSGTSDVIIFPVEPLAKGPVR